MEFTPYNYLFYLIGVKSSCVHAVKEVAMRQYDTYANYSCHEVYNTVLV